jgi:hypothetical protein
MADVQRGVSISVLRRKRVEQFELQAGSLRIGSAAHCDVRLAPDEAAPEQVALEPRGRGVQLRALAGGPALLLDGAPLTEALVEGNATLEIGEVVLMLRVLEPVKPKDDGSATLKAARQVALVLGVCVLYYVVLQDSPAQSAFGMAVPPPVLFPPHAEPACRHTDREAARVFAEEQLVAADGKRERSPFSNRDGVQAVPLYESAAACFRRAGDAARASAAAAAGKQLAARLEEELHAHRVRLDWFLGAQRYDAAAREVGVLREYLPGREGPYEQWLAMVARELRSVLAQKEQ